MASHSREHDFQSFSSSTAEMLQLNKTKNQGPCKTFKPNPSSVLSDVKNFLPKLAMSNQILKETVDSGQGESVNIEHIEDTDNRIIQIDLALVEQDSDSEDSDSSEESIQGEITEENIKIEPKCKNKPVIELITDIATKDTIINEMPNICTSTKDTPTTNTCTLDTPVRDTNTQGDVCNDRQEPICDDG